LPSSKVEKSCANQSSKDYHWVQADKSSFGEIPYRHTVPTVIIGIANDEARKHKEKVNSKIAMIDGLIGGRVKIGFKQMMCHDKHGGNTTKSVKDFISWLGGEVNFIVHVFIIDLLCDCNSALLCVFLICCKGRHQIHLSNCCIV